MILNRPLTLWTAAFAAVVNVALLLNVVSWSVDQAAGVNLAFAAVLALLANSATLAVRAGNAAAKRIAGHSAPPLS